jgi:hypothetical protein
MGPPDTLKNWLSVVESVSKIAALACAGAWAYYQYFRGRIYEARLELAVSGSVFTHHQSEYLIAIVKMKNVGLSKVAIQQKGTGLRITTCEVPERPYSDVRWVRGRVYEVFVHHAGIEPGEPIEDRVLIALPAGKLAVQLEFRVESGEQEWNTQEIIHSTGLDAYDRNLELVRQFEEIRVTDNARRWQQGKNGV